jgi:hypothetical protein
VEPVVVPEPESARIDRERLARAREEVRVLLLECASGLDPRADRAEVLGFAERFDRLSHKLRVLGWPRERLVAGLLDGDDPRAARAAARYLGVRADALSARELEEALAHDDRKRAAARALADLGEPGLDGMARALDDPQLRRLALRGVARVGGRAAARTLEGELRREVREDALAALTRLGPQAVEAAIRLRLDDVLDAERTNALLAAAPDAGPELARQLADEPPGPRALALAEAAAAVAPGPALEPIERLCLDRRTRDGALACLGSIEHPGAVRALMRLRESGRVPADLLDPAARASVARNAETLAGLAWEAIDTDDLPAQSELLDFLIESDGAGAAPALCVLAGSPQLDDASRQAAALAVGELGTPDELPALAELLARLTADQRHLAAACVLSTHALGGEEACAAVLEGGPERERQSILTLLRRRRAQGRTTVSIFKLARALEPWLEARPPSEWSESP